MRQNHLAAWSEQQHTALMTVFKQRKLADYIRECHGDCHLGNIALIGGEVVLFDGIEFNPSLYWIDVISEIAFLVMDLQEKTTIRPGFSVFEYLPATQQRLFWSETTTLLSGVSSHGQSKSQCYTR